MQLNEIANELKDSGLKLKAMLEYEAPITQVLGTGGKMLFAYSFSIQAAEVKMFSNTGKGRVLRVI